MDSRMIQHKRLVGMVKSNYRYQLMMKGGDIEKLRDAAYMCLSDSQRDVGQLSPVTFSN